jgi:hypothetical protein
MCGVEAGKMPARVLLPLAAVIEDHRRAAAASRRPVKVAAKGQWAGCKRHPLGPR